MIVTFIKYGTFFRYKMYTSLQPNVENISWPIVIKCNSKTYLFWLGPTPTLAHEDVQTQRNIKIRLHSTTVMNCFKNMLHLQCKYNVNHFLSLIQYLIETHSFASLRTSHEGVWDRGGTAPRILELATNWSSALLPEINPTKLFEQKHHRLLGCCAVQSRTNWSMFQRYLLRLSSGRLLNVPEHSNLHTPL